ncbi:MAG TPA: rhodanese-like domain-containing protein [Acidimicrobiia bacterium]|nr:rhodanese-like domain-containing protein [Acidimicrobiia bacterium]
MKTRIIAASLSAVVLLGACGSGTATADAPATQSIQLINPADANQLLADNEGSSDFVILDIRTPEEFNSGRIAGSVNIDFYQANFSSELDNLDKDKTYFVYCNSGNRSGSAMGTMRDLGFVDVYDLAGGIQAWYNSGFNITQ